MNATIYFEEDQNEIAPVTTKAKPLPSLSNPQTNLAYAMVALAAQAAPSFMKNAIE